MTTHACFYKRKTKTTIKMTNNHMRMVSGVLVCFLKEVEI